jgi:hypothetical protein
VANDGEPVKAARRFDWERALRESSLNATAKHLGHLVATYASADGRNVRPGLERLSVESSRSMSVTKRAMRTLREEGWLHRTRQGNSRIGMADEYVLSVPDQGSSTTPNDSDQGSSTTPNGSGSGVVSDSIRGRFGADQGSLSQVLGVVHDPPPDRVPDQDQIKDQIKNHQSNPTSDSQADSFDGDDSRQAVEAESLAPLASPQATAGADPWAGIETDDGGTQDEWSSQQAVLAGSFSLNPEDPWAGIE